MKKYAVYPGYVLSKIDRDRHFITALKLMFLYGVSPEECLVVPHDSSDGVTWSERARLLAEAQKLIPLSPRTDGNYSLPAGEKVVRHVAILGSLKERGAIKLVLVPEGQSPGDDGPPGYGRKWLWPHLEGGWHLLEFVSLEALGRLARHTAQMVAPDEEF